MRLVSHEARRGRCVAMCAALALAGCTGAEGSDDAVLVLAAASLSTVFVEFEAAFEAANPGVDIELSFSGSSAIRVQLEQGAPADIIALADPTIMEALVTTDQVGEPTVFASNSMSIAVPQANPGGVESIDDFTREELALGLCASQVPCGRYADEVFASLGFEPSVDTREPDVRSLSAKVASGELDAAIVYDTDIAASQGTLGAIALPAGAGVSARYPIAVTSESNHRDDAQRFLDFVLSEAGQAILSAAGFEAR